MKSMNQTEGKLYPSELQEQLKQLTAFVERAAQQETAAHEVEQGLWWRVLALGRQAMGLYFALCGDGDDHASVSSAAGA